MRRSSDLTTTTVSNWIPQLFRWRPGTHRVPQHISVAPPRPLHRSLPANFPTRNHTLLLAPMEAGRATPSEWFCCRSGGQCRATAELRAVHLTAVAIGEGGAGLGEPTLLPLCSLATT